MAQTYKYTIVGDTQPAVKGNEVLDASINKVDASTKKLSEDTKKLGADTQKVGLEANKAFGAQLETKIKATDAKIKTITGTVGLFTGTLSTAIGALGLFGIDDEQISGFQKATLSVLALGSGAAQAITGFKDLTEAKKLQNEVTLASTGAENANTAALTAQAAAAGGVTIALGNAATSITSETIATEANTIAKAGNITADEVVFTTRQKLAAQGAFLTEAQIAQTLGLEADTAAKGANAVVTGTLTVATTQLTIAQRALNLVAKANPYIAVASIIFAVGSAIFALTRNTDDNTSASNRNSSAVKTNNELRKEQLQTLKDVNREYLDSNERLKALEAGAKARNISILEEAKAEKARAKEAIERANKELALIREGNTLGRTTLEDTKDQIEAVQIRKDEAQKYYDSVVEGEKLYLENTKKTNEENAKRNKQLRDERLEREGILQLIQLEINEAVDSIFFAPAKPGSLLDVRNLQDIETTLKGISTTIQEIDFTELEDFTFLSQEQLDILKRLRGELNTELKQQLFAREQQFKDELFLFADNEEAKTRLTEEYEQDRATIRRQYAIQTASELLGITSNFLNVIGDINQQSLELQLAQAAGNQAKIEQINKEALERQKKLRIAQIVVSTAEAVINAFTSTSQIPPPFGQIIGGALAASYVALGAKSIATVNATTLDGGTAGGGFNNIPGGGGAFSLPGGAGVPAGLPTGGPLPGLGGGRIGTPTIGTIGQEPLRAYVLAGDVTNGVQANVALNNRRRLTG